MYSRVKLEYDSCSSFHIWQNLTGTMPSNEEFSFGRKDETKDYEITTKFGTIISIEPVTKVSTVRTVILKIQKLFIIATMMTLMAGYYDGEK